MIHPESTLEQAALRRIATLVAEGVQPEELFAVVAEEVGRVIDAPSVAISRYEPDATATVCGTFPSQGLLFLTGTRVSLEGASVLRFIREHGEPARVDNYTELDGEIADAVRRSGLRSSVGVPILVAGDVWGAIVAADTERLPEDTGARLAEFTGLVAAAIANSAAREALAGLADEQAALRRVATLVARDTTPAEIFAAVSAEVDRAFGLDAATLDVAVIGRFEPGPELVVVGVSKSIEVLPIGSRWPIDDLFAPTHVLQTGRSARIRADDVLSSRGETAEFLRKHGYLAQVASPILVDGLLWGAMSVSTRNDLPPDTEERLERFTELVATAIANAESRETLAQLADEQAALRRVATQVAEGVRPEAIFSPVGKEIGRLFGSSITTVGRFEPGAQALVVLGVGTGNEEIPIGSRWEVDDLVASARVLSTGGSARVDGVDWSAVGGPLAPIGRLLGVASTVASPIFVDGHLWGVVSVSDDKLLPRDAEERLENFSELIATAIANAESHDALARLADEQAALRRIATLVAQGVQPDAIFSAVGDEVGRVFGSSIATVGRFESDPPMLVMVGVGAGGEVIQIGSRWELDMRLPSGQVFRTGRSARVDRVEWSEMGGPLSQVGSRLGIVSAVASPIFVERRLWGVISVSDDEQLPPDAEERLEKFTELIATAIANAESSAELAASRRRIVDAADEARRRIERDLHDGIQQRLIALSFHARAMSRRPPEELPGLATELAEGLKDASDELREVSRGIHPTILTEAGLGPALRALARRADVPIEVDVKLDERLPAPIEAAAYYIASEALTNVAKHAQANVVELVAAREAGVVTLEVRDDGIGGVDPGRGSGILGLTDRVEALGGTISIASPADGGTTVSVRLPITT